MQETKKMYRAIHRTANARFDIWFVCAKNKIEARKIIIGKTGYGIVEFPDYQGIPERYMYIEYGEAKKYEYTRGKFI